MSRFLPVILVGALVFCTGCPMGTTGNENMNDGDNENMNDGGGGGEAVAFSTTLSGDNEVPAVDSVVTAGVAELSLSDDLMSLDFSIGLLGGVGITAAHIHLGAADENGDIVASLFSADDTTAGQDVEGSLATGTLTADDLVGTLAGMPMSELVDAMRAGNAYVNVHSAANPGGEVRGQLAGVAPDDAFICFGNCSADVFKAIPGNGQRE